MKPEVIKNELAKRLTLERYEHSLRVADTAIQLAKTHRLSESKAELAALLHDVAKCKPKNELKKWLMENLHEKKIFSFHHELWHAPVGSLIAKEQFSIDDEDILNAICYHTTGRANMSSLEKLIYVADMVEPGRVFPNVEQLREVAKTNIDKAMKDCIVHSMQYLVRKKSTVYPDSLDCYNEHILNDSEIRKEQ